MEELVKQSFLYRLVGNKRLVYDLLIVCDGNESKDLEGILKVAKKLGFNLKISKIKSALQCLLEDGLVNIAEGKYIIANMN